MKKILLLLFLLSIVLAIVVWLRHGGGEPFTSIAGTPLIAESELQEVLAYDEPIGNVAVSAAGEVFFTIHPESRPQGNKLMHFVNGASVPFPDVGSQRRLFDTVLGIVIDRQNRLWTIDHGNHGMRSARLLAFDVATGELIHDQRFDASIAPAGSYLQDLQVSRDGRTVIIADASFWRKRPALIVYDIGTATARRVLQGHVSVSAENYVIHNHGNKMTFGAGLVTLKGGVDGIALDQEWLYFGAINAAALYRIQLADLTDRSAPDSQLAARVERYADKPLSDGFSIDVAGNVYVTDVEHGAVFRIAGDREPKTLVRSQRIRWADSLSFGPDGWLYVADSALFNVVLQSREHIKANGPYRIYRLQAGIEGTPGQ
ncbi:MAG: major royal jelly family protein [Gammaproteobacteria bacterium]|nr:major royal jelly family protein [Gammaproteobacteria bacterium]MDH5303983.1 major royal jelly family protein [Gammaproteobacteria bacterium]MDH5321744.1 major royal jelly family protein [Gammaproteobacteria bacterium]